MTAPSTGPGSSAYPRTARATSVREACAGLVDDLSVETWLLSVYLVVDGRLRCQASRGYFQVSDGFPMTAGVMGRVVSSGCPVVVQDVAQDRDFVAAIPGLRSEVGVPLRVHGEVVGAVNVESRSVLAPGTVDVLTAAAAFLGGCLERLGGPVVASLAERVARHAVELAQQTTTYGVRACAVDGALDVSGMSSAAIASLGPDGVWTVDLARGPLRRALGGWGAPELQVLAQWVSAGTSSHFPDGEQVPEDFSFLSRAIRGLSVQPLVVAGVMTGLLVTADADPSAHDPDPVAAVELLASQTAATLAMVATVQSLERRAHEDSLTALGNRRRLLAALEGVAAAADIGARGAALVLLDLDGFKGVNDVHGHAAGDALLVTVARSLQGAARVGDLVCRLGGDEFAVLLAGPVETGEARAAGARFVEAVHHGSSGVGHPAITASAGVRLLVDGASASSVLSEADLAMYTAKRGGPGRCVVWEPALQTRLDDGRRLMVELDAAMAGGGLSIVFQPIVEVESLRVRGVEVLARWEHPVRGQVPPAEFVACAERSGQFRALTRWVLRTALGEASTWPPAADGDHVTVAVNISAVQLGDELIVEDVRDALAEAGLTGAQVVLEVSETALVVDLDRARATLRALDGLGVRLALDDFGAGFSSLNHAQSLPFHFFKIDRSVVAAAATGDRRSWATIAAVCALSAGTGADVVAVGVESRAQLAQLRAVGVTYAQGYVLSRPQSATQVRANLHRHGPTSWTLPEP
jgi:diguanylate cyclase (GGDEF)-like protein